MAQLTTLRLNRFHPRDLLLLVYLGPMITVILQSLAHLQAYYQPLAITSELSLTIGLLLSLNSLLMINYRVVPKAIISLLLSMSLLLMLNHLHAMPSRFLFVSLFIGLCFRTLFDQGRMRQAKRQLWRMSDYLTQLMFYASNFSFIMLSAVFFFGFAEDPFTYGAVIYCASLTLLITALRFLGIQIRSMQLFTAVSLLMIACASASVWMSEYDLARLALYMALLPLANYFLPEIRQQLRSRFSQSTDALFRFPEGAVLVYFIALSIIGTLLLYSPISSAGGQRLSFLDSAFTAVSAVCVTGLTVVDTSVNFSFWGQFFIMLLIEMGGLGIMTLSSLFVLIVGRRLSVTQEEAITDSLGSALKGQAAGTVRQVLIVTFTAELIGAAVLSIAFWNSGLSWSESIWKGIFTAVSAFCNAGFALDSQSLVSYQGSPLILTTVSVLIMLGGLSPALVVGIPRLMSGQKSSVQTKIVLTANGILWFGGALFVLLLEWQNTLVGMPLGDKVMNAFFQSVSARTAGFNTLDMSLLKPATLFVLMLLMFIGGSPGGTAGGIKTTTFMLLLFTMSSVSRGYKKVSAFHRHIPQLTVYRASTVAIGGLITGFIGLMALLTTQRLDGLGALFETVSALGTVGLSIGTTSELDQIGKIIVVFLMLLGRVGPLSVVLFLGKKREPMLDWTLSREDVSVA